MAYDSAVVGAGVMGYSAALQLARSGRNTVLLEQFQSPHTRGSSTGQSRATRIANYGTKEMNPIMVSALAAWKQIQEEVEQELLIPSPMLCIGQGKKMDLMRQAILESGSSPTYYTSQQVQEMYGFQFPSDHEYFVDEDAGVLLADQCILALKKLFEKYGGTVLDRWPVTKLEQTGSSSGSVLVHGSNKRTVSVSRAVVCAGPWTKPLLQPLGVELPLTPLKTAVCYWRQKDPLLPSPLFVARDAVDGPCYGLPSIEYPGLVKVSGCGDDGIPCDPNNRDETSTEPMVANIADYVRKHFPCLQPQPAIVESCMYTVTPDFEMILDRVPGCPNIAYGCGFSGTGFKLGPTVGRLLSQMVTGQPLDHDVARFSAARFTS